MRYVEAFSIASFLLLTASLPPVRSGALVAQDPSPLSTPDVNVGAPPNAADSPATGSGDEGIVTALHSGGEIALDGRLDEPVWRAATAITDLRQQEPGQGAPASRATEVKVVFTRRSLYVGARMADPEAEGLIARILERDVLLEPTFGGVTSDDDAFFIVLDTYDDDRSGFVFGTNPNGAEADALLRDEGNLNLSWDAVWRVATSVDGGGWTAEIEIPFASLRFARATTQRWGVNFQRVIKRANEIVLWRSWTRDNGGLLKVSQAGSLTGLAELDSGRDLQLKPFMLAEGRRDLEAAGDGAFDHSNEGSLDAGLDAKLGITSNLTLDATLNTDFAQVEADIRQINLTRFSLFFPEKREFFLEGAGIFDFGVPGFGGPPPALLFFSRRIGIEQGVEVPIVAGTKLTGKEGPWSVGVLDVVTDDEDGISPVTNFGVARLTRELGRRSQIGGIFTHRAPEGETGAVAAGADLHVQISQKMVFDTFAAATDVNGSRGGTGAYRAALDFTADRWGWLVEQLHIGRGFDPPVGFILRNDVNRQFATFRLSPRPDLLGLRRVDLRWNATIVSSEDWKIRDRDYRFTVTPQLDSGDRLELAISQRFERLTEPFDLTEELVFAAGDYDGHSYSAELETSTNRAVRAELFAGRLGFFSGRNVVLGATLGLAASRNLSFEAAWEHNAVDAPEGRLDTDLANLRVNYAFSTRLFTNALIQYDSTTDEIDANVRLNLIHSPGSDLFVVLNERRGEPGDLFQARTRALVVKFTKLLTF